MCCNTNHSCCCRCNCGCDSGITTLPSFPDQPAWSGDLSGYPVYVSVPTFLWNGAGDSSNGGCGCGCG